jgi:glycosyltransferase involved in cell wall biosynthesis
MTDEKPAATVVVSTYNRPNALRLVLLGLSNQTLKPSAVHIADDGSEERTQEVIQSFSKQLPIRHFWHEDQGYRKTIIMNQALEAVETPLSIFLDGDCIPLPTFVEDHVAMHATNAIVAGPRILASAALTSRLERQQSISALQSPWFWIRSRLFKDVNRLAPIVHLSPAAHWRSKTPLKWELVRGCNFSVETYLAKLVGGFEESLHGWGPDDSDIAVRLINAGARVKNGRFCAPVLHLWHREEDRGYLQKNREYLQTAIQDKRTRAIKSRFFQSDAELIQNSTHQDKPSDY